MMVISISSIRSVRSPLNGEYEYLFVVSAEDDANIALPYAIDTAVALQLNDIKTRATAVTERRKNFSDPVAFLIRKSLQGPFNFVRHKLQTG